MTIETVKPAGGGNWTTLTGWAGGLSATLTVPQQADLYKNGSTGLVESGGVALNGFTTTSTNKLIVNVPTAERHNGTKRSGAFLVNTATGGSVTTFRVGSNVDNVDVSGMDIESLDTAGGSAFHWNLACGVSNRYLLDHSIIHATSVPLVISAFAGNGIYIYRNTLFYSEGAQRIMDIRGVTSTEVSNCTFWTNAGDFPFLCDNNASNIIKNSYAGGASNQCWHSSFCGVGNNNASSDTTATACYTSSVNSIAGATAYTSVTAGSEDFRTKTGFTGLNGLGATLGSLTDDIIGTARPQGANYDIGIFENILGASFIAQQQRAIVQAVKRAGYY